MNTNEIKAGWSTLTVSIQAVQKRSQELLVASIAHAFDNRLDFSLVKHGLNCLENVGGSFRMQAVIAYLEEFAGVSVEKDTETGHGFLVTKDNTFSGKRNVDQLNKIKATNWYEWAVDEKPLNTPVISANFWINLARGYASGTITMDEIKASCGVFGVNKVEKMAQEEKILKWAEKYQQQNPVAAAV